jgi:hypothetical protein
MKSLIIGMALLTLSFSTFAQTLEIKASDVSCPELKNAIANYREVIVVTKFLGLTSKSRVTSERPECSDIDEAVVKGRFKTNDIPKFSLKGCQAGYYCKRIHIPEIREPKI